MLLGVAFFVYKAALGKILMVDKLRKRKVVVLHWCCMCKHNGWKSVDHLLLHCEMAKEFWALVFHTFGIK